MSYDYHKRPIVGFTGTDVGMTDKQKVEFKRLIRKLEPREFHHGDCIGADEQAHDIVWEMVHSGELPGCSITIHPPENDKKRAYRRPLSGGTLLPERPYLKRNRDIVRAATVLIATPETVAEVLRDGAWATIRYGRRKFIPIYVIKPY